MSPVDKFKCKRCGRVYLAVELKRTKCSENFVGSYLLDFCEDCFGRLEYVDEEWNKAASADERPVYYWVSTGCGKYVKKYKPALASLVAKRTGFILTTV